MEEEHVVINDLLSFVGCNIKILSKENLLSSVRNYYNEESIQEAKSILSEAIPQTKTSRQARQVKNRDPLLALYESVQLLSEDDMPFIVCRDLNNIPVIVKSEPESTNEPFSIIKDQQKNMRDSLQDLTDDISELNGSLTVIKHLDKKRRKYAQQNKRKHSGRYEDLQEFHEIKKQRTENDEDGNEEPDWDYESSEEDESICLEENDTTVKRKHVKKEQSELVHQRIIQLDNQGGHMTMMSGDDVMQGDAHDIISDNARIDIADGKPIKIQKKGSSNSSAKVKKEKSCFIIVDNCFDENIGNFLLYRCSQCDNCSNDEAEASAHVCSNTNKRKTSYTCKFCYFQSSNIMQLNDHLSMHNTIEPDEGAFDCVLCYFKCNDPEEFQGHLMTHSWKKPYKCTQCAYKGYDEYRMKSHSLKHAEYKAENEYECQICLKICGTQKALKRHKMLHARKYDFQCQYCNITYKNRSTLENHVLSHTKEKSFACQHCKRVCDSPYTLFMHEKVHFRKQTFECTACGIKFNNRNSRRLHILAQHPDLKPFKCDLCHEAFTFKQSYLVHRNTHTSSEQRKVSCPLCSKKFKTTAYMKMHVGWIHKGSKPYWCSICNFQSRLKSEVNKHEAEHRLDELTGVVKTEQSANGDAIIETLVPHTN